MNFPEYKILTHDKDLNHIELQVFLPSDLAYFKGHFPDYAILPGVAQIAIAVKLARRYLSGLGPLSGMKQLKFSRPITPMNYIGLRLVYDTEKQQLNFQFFDADNIRSKGLICLAGER